MTEERGALIEAMAREMWDAGELSLPERTRMKWPGATDGAKSRTWVMAEAALTAISNAGCTIVSKDELHELLRTANEAREALDMGTRYERGAGGMTIDAQIARTFIGNVPARIVEPLHMALAAFNAVNPITTKGPDE